MISSPPPSASSTRPARASWPRVARTSPPAPALAGTGKASAGGKDPAPPAGRPPAEPGAGERAPGSEALPPGSPLDPGVQAENHDPTKTWDPMVDYAMMSRNVRGFMS